MPTEMMASVRPENIVLAAREKVTAIYIAEWDTGKKGAAGHRAAKEINALPNDNEKWLVFRLSAHRECLVPGESIWRKR
jgi:hypothetical protein